MPRDPNFYQATPPRPAAPKPAPVQRTQATQQPAVMTPPKEEPLTYDQARGFEPDEEKKAVQGYWAGKEGQLAKDTVKFLPRATSDIASSIAQVDPLTDDQIATMSPGEQLIHAQKVGQGMLWNMAKAVPAEIIKTPFKIWQTLAEGQSRIQDKLFGPGSITGFGKGDKVMTVSPSYDLPFLGEVRGFGGSYDEGRRMGMGPFLATVKAAGESAGDIAGGLTVPGVSAAARSAFRPVNAIDDVAGAGFKKLAAEQITTIGNKRVEVIPVKAPGEGLAQGNMITIPGDKNPKVMYMQLPKEVTTGYKGSPKNTFLKITPLGNGEAEVAVMQVRNSVFQMAKDKVSRVFGSNAVTGKFGPEVKLDSSIVKYEPMAPTKQSDVVPSMKLQPGADEAPFMTKAEIEASGTLDQAKLPETPSLMAKPIKGFEDELVTEKQIGQMKAIQQDRGLDDSTFQAVSKVVTGKNNVYELSQAEAFKVSETVRSFAGSVDEVLESGVGYIPKTMVQGPRYWMEEVQREMKIPLYTDLYEPLETGLRLKKVFARQWQEQSREVFGKYSGTDFLEERRAITQYIEGNKQAIVSNKAFTPEVKADLVKIGDWLQDKYKSMFQELGIESDRFFGVYSPKIRERGGIFNIYKTDDLPAELRPFFEYERQGSLAPLEDDALALFDIYSNVVGKKKFVQDPVNRALPMIEDAPFHIKKAANDYIQEKLGFQGATEEFLNRMGRKLSQKTGGLIPENIMKQTEDFLMTNSYAGALGIPRIMPILRNYAQPLLMVYPELDAKWFTEGLKRLYADGGLKAVKDKGFYVEMGIPYGAELAQKSGRGPIGRAVERYKDIGRLTMKPQGHSDSLGRGIAYHGTKARFDYNWGLFRDGKISYDDFANEINLDGFSPTLRNMLEDKFRANTPKALEEAVDLMATDVIDRTMFPLRRGASGRAFHGLRGKMGLQFGQYPAEYLNTLAKGWAARGQWMKVIRWMAASTIIKRSMEETLGVDVSTWVNAPEDLALGVAGGKKSNAFGAFSGFPIGPIGKIAASMVAGFNASMSGMEEDVNKHWADITRAIKIYGGPITGVGAQKVKDLLESVKRYEAGLTPSPDPKKPFPILSSTGKLLRYGSFAELLKVFTGFDTPEETEFSERNSMFKKETDARKSQIDKAMRYFVDGEFDKFDAMVNKYGLMIGDIKNRMKSYNTPLDQRMFDRMPLDMKVKYYNVIYPQ